ncbi:MAG: protease modulator HflK [Planctomycetes bacterium]|nr:protease modulator HflK [Planctomycetota bacterium]
MSEQHTCPHGHSHHEDETSDDLALEKMDTADKSLADALRISFVILKVIMVIVVIAFFASGFQTIGPDEQGLVLRFGKIQTVGADGDVTLDPGLRWVFPYPIDELIKIPVENTSTLSVNSFWYYMTPQQILNPELLNTRSPSPTLNPVQDGYSLTRGESAVDLAGGDAGGNDYNIVHSRWQVTYKIKDAQLFFTHVFVRALKPGEKFLKQMEKDVRPLLLSCFEEAVVTTTVRYSIDEALDKIGLAEDVKALVQAKLDSIECGLSVQNVTLNEMTYPRQVAEAFDNFFSASQEAKSQVNEAQTLADTTLTKTAGGVARALVTALKDPEAEAAETEALWGRLAGEGQETLASANAYRTSVVAAAEAAADYFKRLLPEYRKHPDLVVQNLYFDTVQAVIDGIDEKFILHGKAGDQSREVRIQLNRDPALKRSGRTGPTGPNTADAPF